MQKPLKILSVGHSYVVAMNRSILRELAKDENFEVTVGAPSVFKGSLRTIELEAEPEGSKLKIESLTSYLTQKMHVFAYNPFQLDSLMRHDFDGAHFWEEPYILAGYQLTRSAIKHDIPYVFRTAQSLIKNYVPPFSYFEKSSLQGASGFIAGGHLVHQAMRDKGWELPGRVLTLAVDTNMFKPLTSAEKTAKRKELGLDGPVIGYLGRLSEEKGCDLFMQALANLKTYPWSFLVMGAGPYKDKIEKWAKSEGLDSRIKVALYDHDHIPKVLPVCDLLICPSQTRPFWKEQFGRMIVEGFAAGVPVMGSDSGEIPRVIGEAGVVLPEADVKAWTEGLRSFLEAPASFEPYREKGLARAHQYSAKSLAEQYKLFYRNLAAGRLKED